MKLIYKVLYPIGYEIHEVADDSQLLFHLWKSNLFKIQRIRSRSFSILQKNVWEEVVTQNFNEKLELIETLNQAIQKQNEELKIKAKEQETQLTDTQLALAEVYEMLIPADAAKGDM